MGVIHFLEIGHQFLRQFDIAKRIAVRIGAPGTRVHLIDIHGAILLILRLAFLPCLIMPLISFDIIETGRVGGTGLKMVTIRVTLQSHGTVIGLHTVLVNAEIADVFNLTFPHAAVIALVHGIGLRIPSVEITYYGNSLGVGRPSTENHFSVALTMRTHILIGTDIFALIKKVLRQASAR